MFFINLKFYLLRTIKLVILSIYFSKFCINNSININRINEQNHVKKRETHNILKKIIERKKSDIKNHCLKLVKTW